MQLRALSLVSATLEIDYETQRRVSGLEMEYVTSLVRKATGNHLIKFHFPRKAQSPVSGFCYARNGVCNAVNLRTCSRHEYPVSSRDHIVLFFTCDFR